MAVNRILTNKSDNSTNRIKEYWNRRGGVNSLDLIKLFEGYKFQYLEFGNYVNQRQRDEKLRAFLNGCEKEMSKLMKTKNLGIDRHISVSFGGRGTGTRGYSKTPAIAHFEPATCFINFTKNHGLESFAHEYFHALDYLVGRYIEPMSRCNYLSQSYDVTEPLPPIRAAMQNLMLDYYLIQKEKNPNFLKVDNLKYWASPVECFARLSEQCTAVWLVNHNITNTIAKNMKFYQEHSNVYMPFDVMIEIYPLWEKLIEKFRAVIKGKI